MTDTATTPAPATPSKGPKGRQAKPKKQKVVANHPKYVEMTVSAISALKERNGSSRQAILKYIMSHYSVGKDPKVVNTHLKMALKRGVSSGVLKHSKGQGASGSFRVTGDKKVAAEKKKPAKPKKPVVVTLATPERKAAKAVAKKPKKPKAKAAEKKKAKSPKKEKKPKTPKKSVEKKKKVAAKPKKPKTPKKSPEKKKAPKAKKAAKPKSPKAKRGRK